MNKKDIQDVYPLTPLQEGLLFHAILDPESNAYFDQFIATIQGDLDLAHFEKTWQLIQENNPIFRTAFAWQSGKRSLQVVARQAKLDYTVLDWRDKTSSTLESTFTDFLETDRSTPFNLSKPPLMRITLVQLPEKTFRLVWSRHHLLLDGWSLSLILEEFVRYYSALSQGHDVSLISRRPYRDYIQWLEKQDTEQAKGYWKKALGDVSHCTRVRIGHNTTPTGEAGNYTELTGKLSGEDTAALENLARNAKVTLNTTVKAAWSLLLKRLSGEDTIVMGDTVSGRPESVDGVETQVGLFINTLPLRVDVDPTQSIETFLRQVQYNENELRQYEFSGLSQAQALSDVPSGDALFESIVVFENYPVSEVLGQGIPGLTIQSSETFERTHYPITLIVAPGKQLSWILILDADLYPGAVAQRLQNYFARTLQQLIQEPASKVGQLSLLPEDETRLLQETFNADKLEHDATRCLHHLFQTQAQQTPGALALTDGSDALTYEQLDRQSTQLAHHLIRCGATVESRIGICLERSPRLIISLLGVLKAGATYIPLDPQYPTERIAYMLEDAEAQLVITESQLIDVLDLKDQQTVILDQLSLSGVEAVTLPEPSAANLAYIIYTSGSTGLPKGTAIEHRNAVALAAWAYREYTADEFAAVFTSTSVCFDLSIFEIFVTLGAGGTLVLAENALALPNHPQRDSVTLINTVPSAIAELLHLNAIPASIKTINLAGEPLTAALADKLYAETEVEKVYDLYGPSEDTTYSTWTLRQPKQAASIGHPIANTKLYLLDSHGQLVPQGVVGEIFLQGQGVVRGYWNRPDLTAERFVPDPFSSEPGSRLYRTGDLARYNQAGNLEFLGRADHQIKIRGFRIELGEIQTLLEKHPDLHEAAVIADTSDKQGPSIIAYLVKATDSAITESDLKAYLEKRLPDYMIPSRIAWLAELPRTPNGKLDRKALPQADAFNDSNSKAIQQPTNTIEEQILAIWQEVLSLDVISTDDNFFELGGHSLLATRVLSRIRKTIAKDIPLKWIFEATTIAEQAAKIAQHINSDKTQDEFVIPKVDRNQPLPLSYSQERIWFLQQYDPSNPAYNIPIVLKVQGQLNIDDLNQSFNALIQRHETLRTYFELTPSGPKQVIQNEVDFAVTRISLADGSAEQHQIAEATTPFALQDTTQPLIRAKLLELNADEATLLITLHHIIADGWSFNAILKDFSQYYSALHRGQSAVLLPLPIQYVDYAQWHRSKMQTDSTQTALRFWKDALADVEPIALPTDFNRPAELSFAGTSITQTFPKTLQTVLHQFAQDRNTTLFNVLMTALQALLIRYSGQTNFAIGSPVAGRNHPDLEAMVGVFINTLVFPCQCTRQDDFESALATLSQFSLDALTHQDIPFEHIVEELRLSRDLSRSPLFQVLFVLQNTPLEPTQLEGITLTPIQTESTTAKFDLTISVETNDDGLAVSFEYNTALFKQSSVQQLLTHFEQTLTQLVAAPQQKLMHFALLNADEEQTALAQAKGSRQSLDTVHTHHVHQLFEAQVTRTPENIAVRHQEVVMTYSQLNAAANQLGHALQRQQVSRGKTVAIVLEPSLDMAVSLLAVLKTGAAYVPMDPHYPATRLAHMLEDSNVSAVITTASLYQQLPEPVCEQLQAHDIHPILLDQDRASILNESRSDLTLPTHPLDLAYIIYTSGSTGKPKGSAVYHQGLVNLLRWYQNEAAIDTSTRMLMVSSLSFDLTQKNIFTPLISGGSLDFANSATFDPWELLTAIQDKQITHLNSAPSAFYPLVEISQEQDYSALSSLKQVYLGGESIAKDRLKAWQTKTVGLTQVVNSYGPTECTDVCAFEPVDFSNDTNTPLGLPVPLTQVYVLDDNLAHTPSGVIGEIYVGGIGVGLGYWRQSALTAEKFIPHPFSDHPGARLYQTGDLGKRLPDGRIVFINRKDFQVKIRGLRVELGEIETALRSLTGVSDAIVSVQATAQQHPQIVAHLETQEASDTEVIREQLQTKLPEYMIPAHYACLTALPKTPSGKIDRKNLPAIEFADSASANTSRSPQTSEEKTLAEIWATVLNRSNIGLDDNFFSLGGDSILSIQIISRMNQAGYQLAPRDLFQNQTIATLAQVCKQSKLDTADQELLTGTCPLSPIQHWFFEQDFIEPSHWNQSMLVQVETPLDTDKLQEAIWHLTQQHDMLRCRFEKTEDGTYAASFEHTERADCGLTVHSIETVATASQSEQIEAICQEVQASLDITQGQLYRFAYINTGKAQPHRLLMVFHHLIIDGVSWPILLEDLMQFHQALVKGEAVVRPNKSHAYRQWVQAQQAFIHQPEQQNELPFWRNHLSQSSTRLPRDMVEGENCIQYVQHYESLLSTDFTQTLLNNCHKRYNTNIHEILLTALARTLKTWTQQTSTVVQLESHGRESFDTATDISRTVGWFTAIHPFCLALGNHTELGKQLLHVKETLRSLPNHGQTFAAQRYCNNDNETRKAFAQFTHPEFAFNYLGQVDRTKQQAKTAFSPAPENRGSHYNAHQHRPYLIEINGGIAQNQLSLSWSYCASIHQSATIQRLANHFITELTALIQHCSETTSTQAYSPSDFSASKLKSKDLNKLLKKLKK